MTPEDSPGKVSVTSSSEDSIIDESKTLFLGDLQPNTKEAAELVTALFPSSDVSHIDVKVVNSNKGCLCYAFVTFHTAEAAHLALAKYENGTVTLSDGSISRIGWARRNSRLHVSNLDESITEERLTELFSKYGDLNPDDGILIMRKASSPTNSPSVCYAVLHFLHRDCADTAKNATNGMLVDNRRIRVEWNRASRKSAMTRLALVDGEHGPQIVETHHLESPSSNHSSSPRGGGNGDSPNKLFKRRDSSSSFPSVISSPRLSPPMLLPLGSAMPILNSARSTATSTDISSSNGNGADSAESGSSTDRSTDTGLSTARSVNEGNITARSSVSTASGTSVASSTFSMSMLSPVISIYVQFETLDAESVVNESLITEVFQPFGHMTGCYIKTNNTSVSGLRQHGYAFVHFENNPEGKKSALAAAALSKEAPYQHHGVLLHAEISKNFRRATAGGNGRSFHNYHSGFNNNGYNSSNLSGYHHGQNQGQYQQQQSQYYNNRFNDANNLQDQSSQQSRGQFTSKASAAHKPLPEVPPLPLPVPLGDDPNVAVGYYMEGPPANGGGGSVMYPSPYSGAYQAYYNGATAYAGYPPYSHAYGPYPGASATGPYGTGQTAPYGPGQSYPGCYTPRGRSEDGSGYTSWLQSASASGEIDTSATGQQDPSIAATLPNVNANASASGNQANPAAASQGTQGQAGAVPMPQGGYYFPQPYYMNPSMPYGQPMMYPPSHVMAPPYNPQQANPGSHGYSGMPASGMMSPHMPPPGSSAYGPNGEMLQAPGQIPDGAVYYGPNPALSNNNGPLPAQPYPYNPFNNQQIMSPVGNSGSSFSHSQNQGRGQSQSHSRSANSRGGNSNGAGNSGGNGGGSSGGSGYQSSATSYLQPHGSNAATNASMAQPSGTSRQNTDTASGTSTAAQAQSQAQGTHAYSSNAGTYSGPGSTAASGGVGGGSNVGNGNGIGGGGSNTTTTGSSTGSMGGANANGGGPVHVFDPSAPMQIGYYSAAGLTPYGWQ